MRLFVRCGNPPPPRVELEGDVPVYTMTTLIPNFGRFRLVA